MKLKLKVEIWFVIRAKTSVLQFHLLDTKFFDTFRLALANEYAETSLMIWKQKRINMEHQRLSVELDGNFHTLLRHVFTI